MILFHVLENIGMTIGLLPITGIPLLFCQLWGEAHFLVHLWHLGSCYRRDTMLQKLT